MARQSEAGGCFVSPVRFRSKTGVAVENLRYEDHGYVALIELREQAERLSALTYSCLETGARIGRKTNSASGEEAVVKASNRSEAATRIVRRSWFEDDIDLSLRHCCGRLTALSDQISIIPAALIRQ